MQTTLIFAEIVFYFTVSLAIMVIGVLIGMVVYHLIRIARELEKISHDFQSASSDAYARINDILERLSNLPILSYFLKKQGTVHHKKSPPTRSGK